MLFWGTYFLNIHPTHWKQRQPRPNHKHKRKYNMINSMTNSTIATTTPTKASLINAENILHILLLTFLFQYE